MAKNRNLKWKFKSLLTLISLITGGYFVKTKTTWLDVNRDSNSIKKNEAFYIEELGLKLKGKTEVRVTGGRVDIVTNKYAIEVEWASKWKNAIGQALWYGLQTGNKPKIILLIKNRAKEYKYFLMLNSVLENTKTKIVTEAYYINE